MTPRLTIVIMVLGSNGLNSSDTSRKVRGPTVIFKQKNGQLFTTPFFWSSQENIFDYFLRVVLDIFTISLLIV